MRNSIDIDTQRHVYWLIKNASHVHKWSWEDRKTWLECVNCLTGCLTPSLFNQIFPIKKDYNGQKWGIKDYFSTKNYIEEEIGWDERINNHTSGLEFLFDYWNDDVCYAAVEAMHLISNIHQRQTGESLMEKFARDNGIQLYVIDQDGNIEPYNPNSKLTEE